MPFGPLTTACATPVDALVMVTSEPGTTAPLESVTVPRIPSDGRLRPDWRGAERGQQNESNQTNRSDSHCLPPSRDVRVSGELPTPKEIGSAQQLG